jgi:hypothetical protein
MRRRYFIGACGTAAMAAGLDESLRAATDADFERLCALAAVVVPDEDPLAWKSGPPRAALESAWSGLGSGPRSEALAFLESLDRAADRVSGKGAGFGGLNPRDRAGLLRGLLTESPEFKNGFLSLRSLIVRAFYGSETGFRRTGYIPSTQFRGYPDFNCIPAGREDR